MSRASRLAPFLLTAALGAGLLSAAPATASTTQDSPAPSVLKARQSLDAGRTPLTKALGARQATPQRADQSEQTVGRALQRGQTLEPGQQLMSTNGRWSLLMGQSGRLVLRKAPNSLNPRPYDTILGQGPQGTRYVFQTDGNIVLYGPDDSVIVQSDTAGSVGQALIMQDDGNLVAYGGQFTYSFQTNDPQVLQRGGTLLPGERMDSRDGTRLEMQTDGNLVLYTGSTVRFSSNTRNRGVGLIFQNDGNGVVYGADGTALFSTRSAAPADVDVELGVFDRELAVTRYEGDVSATSLYNSAWTSSTVEPGIALLPGDQRVAGDTSLRYGTDGNLVVYRGGRATFSTGARGAGVAVMQRDGNFVQYVYTGPETVVPRFQTRTRVAGSRLVTLADGRLVVYTPSNRPVFVTP